MSCQLNLRHYWVMIMALLVIPQLQVMAQTSPPPDPSSDYELSFSSQPVNISPLRSQDILPSQSGTVSTQEQLLVVPSFNEVISRELPQLWRMRVATEDVPELVAQYTIITPNENGNPFLNVTLEPLDIREVSSDPNTSTSVVEGGVRLLFGDAFKTGNAGSYQGQISVCVKRNDSGCL